MQNMLLLWAFILSSLWPSGVSQTTAGSTCILTQSAPRTREVPLKFCQSIFPQRSCCIPGFDTYMGDTYRSLVETSDLCAASQNEHKLALMYLFCFGCADSQPNYLRYAGNFTDAEDEFSVYEIMICEDFAKKLAPEHFDDCGLIVPATRSSECPGSGDVIPSAYWGTGLEGALAFLNDDAGGKPPMFENATSERFVVKIDPSNMNCYGAAISSVNLSIIMVVLSVAFSSLSLVYV